MGLKRPESDAVAASPVTGTAPTVSLSELPDDELVRYVSDLGLALPASVPRGELLRRIRERQELLLELDRDALLDIVIWARRPVRQSVGKEALARHISRIDRVRFDGLSQRGLEALARLRGLGTRPGEPRDELERRLRKAAGFWGRVRRARRELVAGLISRAIEGQGSEEYRFLPEDETSRLREHMEDQGVMGGIARRLKGVADDYVREKLDEIEARIDRKLDEIDRRLSEWRDREVSNRLKILKITLLVSILVAVMSLGYDVVSGWLATQGKRGQPPESGRSGVVAEDGAHPSADGTETAASQDNDVREVQSAGGPGG